MATKPDARQTDRATVRRAVPADAAAITNLHVRSWQEGYRGVIDALYLAKLTTEIHERTKRRQEAIVSPWVPGSSNIVAELDYTVAGWAAFGRSRDEEQGADSAERAGEVYALYVHPDHWRHHAGQALMDEAVATMTADGYPTAILWVLEDNHRGRSFYEAMGWQADGARKMFAIGDTVAPEIRYRRSLRPGTDPESGLPPTGHGPLRPGSLRRVLPGRPQSEQMDRRRPTQAPERTY